MGSYHGDSVCPRLLVGQHALGERKRDLSLGGGNGAGGIVLAMLVVVLHHCPPPGLVMVLGLFTLDLKEVPEGEVDTSALVHFGGGLCCLMG